MMKRSAALAFGAAAIGALAGRSAAQSTTTLHVAVPPSEDAAAVHFADAMGFFAKAGLSADIASMQNNPAIAAAVASGAVDIGHGAVDTLAASHAKGIPLVVIAPSGEYVSPSMQHIDGIFVPLNSAARSAKDLNGKVMAVAGLHGLQATASCAWIDKNGGDSSTVKFVEVPFSGMAVALAQARVDAAFCTEPFIDDARKAGRALGYGLDAIGKHFLIAAWYTTRSWAAANPDLVRRFVAVMHETNLWANRNDAKSEEIIATYTKIDPAVLAKMTRGHYAEQFTPSLMQPLIDAAARYNGFATFPAQELMQASG